MKTIFSLLLFSLLVPLASAQSEQTMNIKLYFPNNKLGSSDCVAKVFPVERKIPKTPGVARATLEQLFAGPTEAEKAKGFYSDFSPDTRSFFLSVNIRDGNSYVNLNDPTLTPVTGNFTTSCGGSNLFGQVENTLKQFPSVKKVFFAIKGDPALFYDWMQIGECPKELKNCDGSNFLK
ncbi:MAG TPA: GerMN domain-containing protein [Pyrinomonadaceae bacterium]|nr:GerMN domain-containing protein [Pyrinomonadaceae bacterium]